ncbi:MAG: YidC/Oxa1 family membrane protein insertase [Chloroflexi bacterium]|nr:YidC/Oxa1 family membrane protein insertase [Chloroflexota bacterium]
MWNTLVVDPMLNILLWIYNLLGHNFGLAIIAFTLLVRLLMYPLTKQQLQGAEAMQKLQQDPRWKKIQEKYKNDREKLAQEQMRLYKELGVNPFASCLPTLIQFPIIIGLYSAVIKALAHAPIELIDLSRRIYPFFDLAQLIPLNSRFLWMDLGRPESLHIPGIPFGIPTLAILVGLTAYVQSKIMSPTTASSGGQQNQMMGQMMSIYMPLFLFYLTLTFPSGLGLYFLTSNLATIAQYAFMGKLKPKEILSR